MPAKIFISAGGLEGKYMIQGMTAFGDLFSTGKGIKLTSHIFDDEDHKLVMPAIISRTLRILYGKDGQLKNYEYKN